MKYLRILLAFIGLLQPLLLFAQDEEVLILKPNENERYESSARSVPPTRTAPDAQESSTTFMDFYEKWRQFELQLKLGTVDRNLINELLRIRNRHGIPKITEFAVSAVLFGQAKMVEGQPEEALKLFLAAVNLDPTLSIAYYWQARALIASSWLNIPAAIQVAVNGMFAPVRHLSGKIYLTLKYIFIGIATLLILGSAFALTMLAKYQKLLRHDMSERYTSLTTTAVGILLWVILFIPVFLMAGILWLAPFWLMMFWKYQRNSERIISVIFFLAFMIAYPVYQYTVKFSAASAHPSVAPFMRVYSDGPSPRVLTDFRNYAVEHNDDQDATIMLAHLYRAEGNHPDAIRVLQKHTLDHPEDARVYNNLGHIYFLQGETDVALRMVQKAEDLDGRSSIYPYNLSILQRAKFNFSNAEESLQRARHLDPALVRQFEENPHTSLIDAIPTEKMLFARIQQNAGNFGSSFLNPFTAFSALLLIIALLRGMMTSRKNHAKECIKCGRPFCKRCQPAVKELRFCTQCLHIFVKKDGVSPASRKDKMREIEEYSRRQEMFLRISSLILPGFGNLYKNRVWFGTITLFFWFLFLVFIFYNWRFAHVSFYESPGSATVLMPVIFLFLILLYTVANVSLFRKARA